MSGTQQAVPVQNAQQGAPPISAPATIWGAPITAVLCFVAFLAVLVLAFITQNVALIATESATSGTLVIMAAQFYFGSSNGSQKKDVTLAAQSAMLAGATPTPPPGTSTTSATAAQGAPPASTSGTAPPAPG